MGAFKSNKTFFASPALIPVIARDIRVTFANDGYEVHSDELVSGGYDISVTKGGIFKAILGMKTALKIHIYPANDAIQIQAGVGIFGQQAIPLAISMLVFWPVLITQISGMVKQAKLDNKVMDIAADTIARETSRQNVPPPPPGKGKFCTRCGKENAPDSAFCCACGNKL